MRDLNNMVVAITGASAGIGRALAVGLHRHGARLALAARREDSLIALNAELGGGHMVQRCDVARADDCAAFIAAAQAQYGRIDTLVCNAGYGLERRIEDMSASEWQTIMATNLYGTTACIQAALPSMSTQDLRDAWRAQVMIVSSCLARRSGPEGGAYAATKAAQLSVAESLRLEVADRQIAVTSVHPIGTATEFWEAAKSIGGGAPVRSPNEPTQSADTVAERMIAAMRKPRPEVWPYPMARWAFSFATLFPGLTDRAVRRRWMRQRPCG